ncbi:hypothetical protein BaRGS_00039081, partial [Batillaria attramentaria]
PELSNPGGTKENFEGSINMIWGAKVRAKVRTEVRPLDRDFSRGRLTWQPDSQPVSLSACACFFGVSLRPPDFSVCSSRLLFCFRDDFWWIFNKLRRNH